MIKNREEAIEILKEDLEHTKKANECGLATKGEFNKEIEAIEFILYHLIKQGKMIELLIKHICDVIDNDDGACLLPFYYSDENLEEKVKQYFKKKAEESE